MIMCLSDDYIEQLPLTESILFIIQCCPTIAFILCFVIPGLLTRPVLCKRRECTS